MNESSLLPKTSTIFQAANTLTLGSCLAHFWLSCIDWMTRRKWQVALPILNFMDVRNTCRNRAGFTLIEMMATLGVAAILMAIAIPQFLSVLPGLRLNDAARQVATDLQLARMRAISQNNSNTVTFNTSTGVYSSSLGSESYDIDQLYPGIALSAVTANPVFTSRGTASTPATITLSNGSTTKAVQVTAVGRVRIP